ncbi:hypothetical protein [Thalassotalea euphylliae]|nr:hypothetical protein [Thalassotalea euphylliae]
MFISIGIILSAGVERDIGGVIGLHRPYFDKSYFANLSSLEAKKRYDALRESSEDYLKKMGVKQTLIERMFETDSTNVDILNMSEAKMEFYSRVPFYEEWLSAKCGKFTEEQKRVLKSLGALRAAAATIAWAKNKVLRILAGLEMKTVVKVMFSSPKQKQHPNYRFYVRAYFSCPVLGRVSCHKY